MSNRQTNLHLIPIYKLFFDDIEEIFLNQLSIRLLTILTLITCLFLIGILILLLTRTQNIILNCLIPFLYALIAYDFIQLLSLILLKYNFSEQFFNQFCRWTYYIKASSESGQCLTIIFLLALSRHHIRYFLMHHRLPNSGYIHSRALTFVCLLFIVYVNNWITHLKVEKIHLITLNETKYGINIQEVPLSIYDLSEINIYSHERFINDLDNYSQGHENNFLIQNQEKITTDNIIHNHKDGSLHEIIIKFPYDYLYNPITNRTKRKLERIKRESSLNKTIENQQGQKNYSYRINRCTYDQGIFFLSNFFSLIHSISYFILISYYLITIQTYKLANLTLYYHQQLYQKAMAVGRRKSAERHKQHILLIHLKQFLYLIVYSHTFFTFIHLIYTSLLIIILCLVQTPFKWLPIKILFYTLFLIGYISIPVRMGILFIYLFLSQYSSHIQSIMLYIFHTKLRFSWKLERPTICFRLQFIPYTNNSNADENLTNSLVIDISSSIDEDPSNPIPHESVIVYDETNSSYKCTTTTTQAESYIYPNESV